LNSPDGPGRSAGIRTASRRRRARSAPSSNRRRRDGRRAGGSCLLFRPFLTPLKLRLARRLGLERPGLDVSRRLIGRDDDAFVGYEMIDEVEGAGLLGGIEDALAGAQDQGKG